jgi:anhydro-N-acetylmuramic acid kinase
MKTIYSLGVMTGTSCDGADAAGLAITNNSEKLCFRLSRRFPAVLRARLRQAQRGTLSISQAARLTRDYSEWLSTFCDDAINSWRVPHNRTLLAIHGQTVWHEPESRISVQLLDPAIIANRTNITVTSAFRQPDLAQFGQGAPLLPYYHWLRANALTRFRPMLPFVIFNVGGIANLTYVTKHAENIVAFDTGPGNALIDLAVEELSHGKKHFDKNGLIAAASIDSIDWGKIEKLGNHPFFRKQPPKSTGRELFDENFYQRLPGRANTRVANATAFTAHTMAKACNDFIFKRTHGVETVFVAGGGAENPTLLRLFSRELARLTKKEILVAPLPVAFAPVQALEAMGFARFGYEAMLGRPVSLRSVTGARRNAIGANITPATNYATLVRELFSK